jgi:GGDEF domain-containing protein
MNIIILKIRRVTNALHLRVFKAISKLIEKHDPVALNINDQYIIFQVCIEKEDLCFKIIRKSNLSAQKKKSDKVRDELLKAIKDALKSICRHFDEAVREAGERLTIVFDTYNRPKPMKDLPYDEETVVITNMLDEMENKYAADIEITGLNTWIKELRMRNEEFDQLTANYNEQQAEKPAFTSKEVRKETEKAYQDIIAVIEGDMIKHGETAYLPFVTELNTLIKHNNDLLAQHLGRNKAKRQTEEEGSEFSELENEQNVD